MTLTPSDFPEFLHEVHDPQARVFKPFQWQQQLVDEICESGQWPDVIDVPTGLGKTSALDIAVFTAAVSRSRRDASPLPLRTFLVIDRRIVVDQSYDHALRIGDALANAPQGGVLQEVVDALRPLKLTRHDDQAGSESARPLVVGRMRGGTSWAWRWLDRPDQAAIIVGTIDQLGSRLLFDGYGVGATIRPIDAALVGTNSLVVVDEAHLAEAFVSTVRTARALGAATETLPSCESAVVVMSATTRHGDSRGSRRRFSMDRAQAIEDPTARQRLLAPKRLAAAELDVSRRSRTSDLGTALARAAMQLADDHDVVGVVANTVATARAAFDDLRGRIGQAADDRVVLLTGRQRDVDRQLLWQSWKHRVEAGRPRASEPLFVVATQTIEVGADLDFSGLVTESASVDALVQRLGRLNRRGEWERATAIVVHPSDVTDQDPIYGPARLATWAWLTERVEIQHLGPKDRLETADRTIDVCPSALDDARETMDDTLRPPNGRVPVLFPWVFDRWVRTFPRSLDAPPTGPFLHGLDRQLPTASIVWRHPGIGPDATVSSTFIGLERSIELLPISAREAVDVPVWAIEAWLSGLAASAAQVADLDTALANPVELDEGQQRVPYLELSGDGSSRQRTTPRPIRAGTTIVVPTWRGGLDRYGWNPASAEPVLDIADLADHRIASQNQRRRSLRSIARLDATLLAAYLHETDLPQTEEVDPDQRSSIPATEINQAFAELADSIELDPSAAGVRAAASEALDRTRAVLRAAPGGHARALGTLLDDLATLGNALRIEIVQPPEDAPHLDTTVLVHGPAAIERWSTDTDAAGSSITGALVSLEAHQSAVAQRAATFADSLGIGGAVRDVVVLAAAHHDVGKLDPRFQKMLNGGYFAPDTPLAKSGTDPSAWQAFARTRELAGYPAGMRHEAISAHGVAAAYAMHPERDLLVHLVASHHGRARPLQGAVNDPDPVEIEVTTKNGSVTVRSDDAPDWDQPARFKALNERFGPWGLALLETIVRLADIGCSMEGS